MSEVWRRPKGILKTWSITCWVLVLLSAPMSARAAWHLAWTHAIDESVLSKTVNVAPDLRLVRIWEHVKHDERDRVLLLSDTGAVLYRFSPGADRDCRRLVWLNADRGQARVFVTASKAAPDGGPLFPPHLLTLDVKTGQTLRDPTLDRQDRAFSATRDGREVLIYSWRDPRVLTEDGTVLCHLAALEDSLPQGVEDPDWTFPLGPRGGYFLAIAPNGKDIYHVTSKKERHWELHLSDLFTIDPFVPLPRSSDSGRYLLVGNRELATPAAKFSATKRAQPAWSLFTPQAEVPSRGWSLTLLGIQEQAANGVPGGEGRIVWGTLRLQDHVDPLAPAPYTLGPTALQDRLSLVTVAAWESRGIWLWDITPKGKVQSTTRITPELPPTSVLNEMHLAGDPPVLLVPYERREPKAVGALWLSTDGKELFRWSTEGTDCEGHLSTDGHRALIKSHAAIYMFTDE